MHSSSSHCSRLACSSRCRISGKARSGIPMRFSIRHRFTSSRVRGATRRSIACSRATSRLAKRRGKAHSRQASSGSTTRPGSITARVSIVVAGPCRCSPRRSARWAVTNSLEYISLIGFALIAPFGYLLLRARFPAARERGSAGFCSLLPPLLALAPHPNTDTWGLALLLAALIVALRRTRAA